MTFKRTKKPVGQIARELGVDGIVEGSIERQGNGARITIELYDAKADRQVWTQPYVHEMNSVLEMQSDVARGITDQIQLKLSSPEEARLSFSRLSDPDAVDLYLRGLEQLNTANPRGAIENFRRAIEKDAKYAAPHTGLADCYDWLAERGEMANEEASYQENAEALKAIELDPLLPEGHLVLSQAALNQSWDWTTFQHELGRAKELDPNSARVHWAYSTYFNWIGQQDEALAEAKIAQQFDPHFLPLAFQHGDTLLGASAIRSGCRPGYAGRGIPARRPRTDDSTGNRRRRGRGRYDEAIQAFREVGDAPLALGRLGNAYARAGRTAEARAIIPKLENQIDKTGIGRYGIALIYAALKDRDNAFLWLEKAYQAHEYMMIFMKIDPALSPLHSDRRFGDLAHRVGFPVVDNEAVITDLLPSRPSTM